MITRKLTIELFLHLIKLHALKTCEGMEIQFHIFLTLVLDEVIDQLHAHAALPRGQEPMVLMWWAGWASGPVWTLRIREDIFNPAGNRTSIPRSLNLFLHKERFMSVRDIILITQFWVTVAMNCRGLTRCVKESYVASHERANNLSCHCIVSIMWILVIF
jgi:hypothetical protein